MQNDHSRRGFLQGACALVCAALSPVGAGVKGDDDRPKRKMTIDLVCGNIGVRADFQEALELAHAHGFESVAPDAGYLGRLSNPQLQELLADMKSKHVAFGAANLPVDFRGDDARYQEGMNGLPGFASALEKAGVTRVGTWIRPAHASLTYRANFAQHARRLREVAGVLGDHGLRFGLEYVGPKTSWTSAKYPFIHTMAEARELIAEIHRERVGLVLDSWHWYTAGDTTADLLALQNRDVVACDLNDAPAGIPVDQQIDSRRELPCATGVIDLKAFLGALMKIGYDGPVRAEPFKAELKAMPKEEAVGLTAEAMRKAFALVEP
jgi:sugar phosphate isomerase/epimerase